MTRFCDEAIGIRSKAKKFLTRKDMVKEMEEFKKTGRHAALEHTSTSDTIPPLPEVDKNRPHVFLDIKVRGNVLGRLVIEVFEDQVPLAARLFMNRCREGMADSLHGTRVHRLIPEQALFAGITKGYKAPAVPLKRNERLHHVEAGVVSISFSGAELAVTLSRALDLDASHQVVGRVSKGHDVLERVNEMDCDEYDAPLDATRISNCGLTNAAGSHETLDEVFEAARRNETPQQAAARLESEAQVARDAVWDALQTGMSNKRKPEAAAPTAPRKKTMLDDMLGDVSGSESDDEDS